MTKLLSFCIIISLIFGCNQKNGYQDSLNKQTTQSGFNLRTDLSDFSNKMTESNTLVIFADLSICTSWHRETNILTKKNDEIYIKTYAEGEYIDSMEGDLEVVKYENFKNDSLNFENLFTKLSEKGTVDRKTNSTIFLIIHKKDSLRFWSDGLMDHLWINDYYEKIKRRIYPGEEIYKPILPPEKPENGM